MTHARSTGDQLAIWSAEVAMPPIRVSVSFECIPWLSPVFNSVHIIEYPTTLNSDLRYI